MIWHFFEVWLSLIAAFLIGCTIGALMYDILARTTLATSQGVIADSIGDVVDRIKDRMGVGPAWRPSRRRVATDEEVEGANEPEGNLARQIAEGYGTATLAEKRADDEAVGGEEAPAEPVDETEPRDGDGAPVPIRSSDESAPSALEPPARSGGDAAAARAASEVEAAAASTTDEIVPMRPATLAEPRNGVPDNLQRIRGIGERNEMRLNALGIFHFGQIAAWTPAEMRWVGQHLAFPERMERDDWIGQAIVLASGGDTGFIKSAERRRMRRHQQRMFTSGRGDDEEEDYEDDEN